MTLLGEEVLLEQRKIVERKVERERILSDMWDKATALLRPFVAELAERNSGVQLKEVSGHVPNENNNDYETTFALTAPFAIRGFNWLLNLLAWDRYEVATVTLKQKEDGSSWEVSANSGSDSESWSNGASFHPQRNTDILNITTLDPNDREGLTALLRAAFMPRIASGRLDL